MDEESEPVRTSLASKDSKSSPHDVFGDESGHAIQYKTLSWQVSDPCVLSLASWPIVLQFVGLLMIAEIVSNGMLSLPNAMAAVGV